MTNPKERGIAFSPPMVGALRAGTKTQTRRIIKLATELNAGFCDYTESGSRKGWLDCGHHGNNCVGSVKLPYAVGDSLWVREALRRGKDTNYVKYQIDGEFAWQGQDEDAELVTWAWKPESLAAMYCPRWAARTWLGVTRVKAERLLDILPLDAMAEGVTQDLATSQWRVKGLELLVPPQPTPVAAYFALWDYINGKGAHLNNPWVAAYEFEVK